jgi:hypothetical protein
MLGSPLTVAAGAVAGYIVEYEPSKAGARRKRPNSGQQRRPLFLKSLFPADSRIGPSAPTKYYSYQVVGPDANHIAFAVYNVR